MNDYRYGYAGHDEDEDAFPVNLLQDAGQVLDLTEAELDYGDYADTALDLMTGGIAAGFAIGFLAEYLERRSSEDEDLRERVSERLREPGLTGQERRYLEDLLQKLSQEPDRAAARG